MNKVDEEISYEKAISRLEEISRLLEEPGVALEKSLEIFEEGVRLCRFCLNKLAEIEKRVETILLEENGSPKTASSGDWVTESFEVFDSDSSSPTKEKKLPSAG